MSKEAGQPEQIIQEQISKGDLTLPELVRRVRSEGLTERDTRSTAQAMIEKGAVILDRQMHLKVSERSS